MVRVAFTPAPPCSALRSISTDSKALFTSNATSPLMSERPPVRAARPPPLLRRVPGFCAKQGTHAVSGEAGATRSHTRSHTHPTTTPHTVTPCGTVCTNVPRPALCEQRRALTHSSAPPGRRVCGAMASVSPPPTPQRYSRTRVHTATCTPIATRPPRPAWTYIIQRAGIRASQHKRVNAWHIMIRGCHVQRSLARLPSVQPRYARKQGRCMDNV